MRPKTIIIERDVAASKISKDIISTFKNAPVSIVDRVKLRKDKFKRDDLVIARQRGRFVKRCPGTPAYNCCQYHILNVGIGCETDCTYCFLHHYMNTPYIIYANIDDLITEVDELCAKIPDKKLRIGTGEFIDSIGFDQLTDLNKVLIPKLSAISNLVLEIKTKSKNADSLFDLDHQGRVVISWSLNSQKMAEEEEPKADPIKDRILAAKRAQKAGYSVGFHFDPLIYYSGWKDGYGKVVDQIFSLIDPEGIAWISLGALRFNPGLKPIIKLKFPGSKIIYQEMVPGLDGKLRYFISIRKMLFGHMASNIRSYSKKVPVYLCMEKRELAKELGLITNFNLNN